MQNTSFEKFQKKTKNKKNILATFLKVRLSDLLVGRSRLDTKHSIVVNN